ncbi:hypothetical protein IE81DRAFT_326473 [Ceraceosorus guamensis]|uniref:Uncharacterized protein n=1 Tax=Ceraceosorus guamensis TaxID=1522189 RepID=A0A316VPQ5_9BASI|nr:hypothetical protein IE81DRAFT_326473 [Ceraceosorus guamensis]PWN39502.1 hypothetical protein IE81DRAFT_326473 [Ceraceosorus guamensis]
MFSLSCSLELSFSLLRSKAPSLGLQPTSPSTSKSFKLTMTPKRSSTLATPGSVPVQVTCDPASGDTEKAILKLDATLDLATVLLAKADVTLSASDLLDVIGLINTLKADVSIIVGLVTARLLDIKLGAKALLLQGLLVKLQASIKGFKDACAKKASADSANILIKLALDLDLELSTCIGLLGIL